MSSMLHFKWHSKERKNRSRQREPKPALVNGLQMGRLIVQIKFGLGKLKGSLIRRLERIDSRLSNGQRKWLFYLGLIFWSGMLFYILGTAIRTHPAPFSLPVMVDNGQVQLDRSK